VESQERAEAILGNPGVEVKSIDCHYPANASVCATVAQPEHRPFDNLSDRSRPASLVGKGVCRFGAFAARRYSFAAASSVAMSNFTIFIIAAIALGCFRISPIFSGTICQHRPNLSVSQPQAMGLPPSSSLSQ